MLTKGQSQYTVTDFAILHSSGFGAPLVDKFLSYFWHHMSF